jgi:hypothetical protein
VALRAFAALLTLIAVAALASAQDPDGAPSCAQSNPCEVIVEVAADGITDFAPSTFGTGDWVLFSIYNADDVDHTLTLEGHTFEAKVPAGDIIDTQPIRLGEPGTYDLEDAPSGDTAALKVEAEEVFGDDEKDSPIPGPAPWLVLGLLVAVALVLRRR